MPAGGLKKSACSRLQIYFELLKQGNRSSFPGQSAEKKVQLYITQNSYWLLKKVI